MNNTTSSNISTPACVLSDNALKMLDNYNWASYVYLAPIYFLIGMAGHCLSLLSFWRQSKKKGAYGYQIICCIVDMLEILTVSCHLWFNTTLSGFRIKPGNAGFKRSYAMMFTTAHITQPLDQAFITMSLFTSLSMAVDRVFALAKPNVHKDLRRGYHQTAAVILCFVISASTSAFDAYRSQVSAQDDHYEIVYDQAYIAGTLAATSNYVRMAVRVVGLISLFGFNIALVYLYHKKFVNSGAVNGSEQVKAERKAKERSLIKQTICMSSFTGSAILAMLVHHTVLFTYTTLHNNCLAVVITGAISDFNLQLMGILEFFGFMIISKQFRENLIGGLKRCYKRGAAVSPTACPSVTNMARNNLSKMPQSTQTGPNSFMRALLNI